LDACREEPTLLEKFEKRYIRRTLPNAFLFSVRVKIADYAVTSELRPPDWQFGVPAVQENTEQSH
jgi:hypothetical protein